jgi:hypothetical protein
MSHPVLAAFVVPIVAPAEVPDPGPQDAEGRPDGERRPTGPGPAGLGRRPEDPAGGNHE